MFSSKEYLERKTGPDGIDRFNYLQALVTEYQDTQEQGMLFVFGLVILPVVVLRTDTSVKVKMPNIPTQAPIRHLILRPARLI